MLQCSMHIPLQLQKTWIPVGSGKDRQMAKAQDFNTVMKDVMGAFPVDTKAMEDAFKNQAP